MKDPTTSTAIVVFKGYPEHETYPGGLPARIRDIIETHPTLSFKVESVEVTETAMVQIRWPKGAIAPIEAIDDVSAGPSPETDEDEWVVSASMTTVDPRHYPEEAIAEAEKAYRANPSAPNAEKAYKLVLRVANRRIALRRARGS